MTISINSEYLVATLRMVREGKSSTNRHVAGLFSRESAWGIVERTSRTQRRKFTSSATHQFQKALAGWLHIERQLIKMKIEARWN
jgi:hypothetical protein